jgi:putative transposase
MASFRKDAWIKIRSNNTLERLNKEVKRRCPFVGIYTRAPIARLVGPIPAEQGHDRAVFRRHMPLDTENKFPILDA